MNKQYWRFEALLAYAFRVVRALLIFIGVRSVSSFVRRIYWHAHLSSIGVGCSIYPKVIIHSPSKVSIGNNVSIAEFVHMWGGGGIEIGSNVMIASHCAITSQTHNVAPNLRRQNVVRSVSIGDNVWIGTGAVVLPGVRIGKNSVIGAGSIVTRNIPDDVLAVGAPARVIRRIDSTAPLGDRQPTDDKQSFSV